MSNLPKTCEYLLNKIRSSPKTFGERLESGIIIEYHPPDEHVISFHCPWEISNKDFSWWGAQFCNLSAELKDAEPDEMCKKIMSQIIEIKGVTDMTANHFTLSVSRDRLHSWGSLDDSKSLLSQIIKILENSRPK